MSQLHADNRLHAVALLAVLQEGEGAHELLSYMSDDERDACEDRVTHLIESMPSKREEKVLMKINSLVASEKFSGIAEIHPAWIYEVLKDESPRIMGIIMRYLPSKQVRYILEHLPSEVKAKIPTLLEAFAVPKPVLDVIKHRFESRFLPMRVSTVQDEFDFEHVFYLKGDELGVVFMELGLYEVAMALDGMSEKFLEVILNRLKLKDAKRLHQRMTDLSGVAKELKQQARFAILESDVEYADTERMLYDIGLASFARAVSSGDEELFALIRQKLSPHDAYQLKRMIDEHSRTTPPALMKRRQMLVCRCIASLAVEGKIDANWERFSPKTEA